MVIEQLELALRVAAGLFVIVAPTALFLGLWKGLMYLRDDELIEQVRRMEGHRSTSPASTAISGADAAAIDASESSPTVCKSCGTPNTAGMRFCRDCFGRLPDE